jgi:hypothetical protein
MANTPINTKTIMVYGSQIWVNMLDLNFISCSL